jgi:hypothetical protein
MRQATRDTSIADQLVGTYGKIASWKASAAGWRSILHPIDVIKVQLAPTSDGTKVRARRILASRVDKRMTCFSQALDARQVGEAARRLRVHGRENTARAAA